MSNLKYGVLLLISLTIFTGCQQEQDTALPTLVDLDATNQAVDATNEALAIGLTETALAPTATSLRPTLPPEYTATPDVLPSETPIPTLDPNISPTPQGYRKDGTIYYNYNGDTIARVFPDGTGNEIILTFGVDQPITDITASPNGELIAFVAPAGGSAREVWVTNRDGSYLQQVSCLGYGEVRSPSFAPDSNRIAFFAAPLATTNMALYVADFVGSNDCPTGNNQRVLFPVSTTLTGDIAWNASQDLVYYNAGGTYIYDFASQSSYIVSLETGFGSDFGATFDLDSNQFMYMRLDRDLTTGEQGGAIVVINDADDFRAEYEINPLNVVGLAQDIAFGKDNESIIYATKNGIYVYELQTTTRFTLRDGLTNPFFEFAPNQQAFVYTDVDPDSGVVQLFIGDQFDPRKKTQITFNPEGDIIDVLWLDG